MITENKNGSGKDLIVVQDLVKYFPVRGGVLKGSLIGYKP